MSPPSFPALFAAALKVVPKSVILATHCASRSTLPGLRSRWSMLLTWM